MRQRPRIDQNHVVTTSFQFDRGGDTVNSRANNNDSRHSRTAHVVEALVSSAYVATHLLAARVPVQAGSGANNKSRCRGGAGLDCSSFFRSICAKLELVTASLPLPRGRMRPPHIQNGATRYEATAKTRNRTFLRAARTT